MMWEVPTLLPGRATMLLEEREVGRYPEAVWALYGPEERELLPLRS